METPAARRGPKRSAPQSPQHPRGLRTVEEAAGYLRVSRRTIERWIAQGDLRGYRVGDRLVRIDQADLDALVREIPTVRMAAGFRHDSSGQAAS